MWCLVFGVWCLVCVCVVVSVFGDWSVVWLVYVCLVCGECGCALWLGVVVVVVSGGGGGGGVVWCVCVWCVVCGVW